MNDQRFPKGWDQQHVQELLAELDSRTDEEWVAGDEAAAADQTIRCDGPHQFATGDSSVAGDAQQEPAGTGR